MIQLKVTLLDISELRPHEKYIDERVELLIDDLIKDGIIRKPVVVDKTYRVVLDGHHRVEAFKRLKLQRIPAAMVDYYDPRIIVRSWNNGKIFDKDYVLRRALSGDLLPPRTTRHVVLINSRESHISEITPEVNIPLDAIRHTHLAGLQF